MGSEFSCPQALVDQLFRWYREMVLIRRLDERVLELRSAQEFAGAVHPYSGHEAIAVGVCSALRETDVVVSYYRGLGHAIAAGADPYRLLAERMGYHDGYCSGRAGEFVIAREARLQFTAAIIGSGVPIAAGAALAAQVSGTSDAAVVFFGDGALGAGVVHETMNLASTWRLPVVLVCENNSYQDHTRTDEVYPCADLTRIAEGHLISSVAVDGNDVQAVYAAAIMALDRARDGAGPSFVEAKTYLSRFHLQFDEAPPSYRPKEEEAYWLARDPLRRTREALVSRGVSQEGLDAAERTAVANADDIVRRAQQRYPARGAPVASRA